MKKGFYRGLPVFVDLIDAYEGVPMSDIIKLVNDSNNPPKIIRQVMKNQAKKIKKARAIMRESFEADPNFKRVYIDNVAMYLYDHAFGRDMRHKPTRDHVAERLLDLIFSK
jgi:endo-alpha-1,4-polygalactosaminidase (GH114 family)